MESKSAETPSCIRNPGWQRNCATASPRIALEARPGQGGEIEENEGREGKEGKEVAQVQTKDQRKQPSNGRESHHLGLNEIGYQS